LICYIYMMEFACMGPFMRLVWAIFCVPLVLIQYKVCTFIVYVYLFKTLTQSIKKSVEQTKCA